MNIKDWTRNEIEIACKKENPNYEEGSFDYGCGCYKSALKAYESLCDDEHSGMSFNFAKNILIRLMDGNPLTPITDEDFLETESYEAEEYLKERGLKSNIQCPRMSSLFRKETLDGKISYSDISRCYGIENNDEGYAYSSGGITQIINELFPITMPYTPTHNKYKVYTETFLVDKENGDFDTRGFIYTITPDGKKIDINIFEKEADNGWIRISKEEYEERKTQKID